MHLLLDPTINLKKRMRGRKRTLSRIKFQGERTKHSKSKSYPAYRFSSTSILFRQGKLTIKQLNAGEDYLKLYNEVKRMIPIPIISKIIYGDYIKGNGDHLESIDDKKIKWVFNKWRESVRVLSSTGETVKKTVEDFLYRTDTCSAQKISSVELNLIQRGLNSLAEYYDY